MIRRLALAGVIALFPAIASAQFATIGPTPPTSDNGDRLATTAWVNNFFGSGLTLASGKIIIGSVGGIGAPQTVSGDCTLIASGAITCATIGGLSPFNAANLSSGTLPAARLPSTPLTNSLSANVALSNTSNYFDGPSIAQGTSGTWFVSGTVTINDTAAQTQIFCKLWDGTTVIASSDTTVATAGFVLTMSLSGILATPATNIRISCRDTGSTSGNILFNSTGNSKDSTISGVRIN
jgi:hypothetical protein